MNDSIDTETSENNDLQGAFGDRGTNFNALNFSHPYAEGIIDRAMELFSESEAGKSLIYGQKKQKAPIHVIKGNGEAGYNKSSNVIYIPVPSKKQGLDAKTFILFIKAFRLLDQEFIGMETPDQTMDVMNYAARLHAKNLDSIIYACKVVQEMSNSKIFKNLLDEIESFGYIKIYRGLEDKKSFDELYAIYSEGN